jgi:preprotein translocase subunit SecE
MFSAEEALRQLFTFLEESWQELKKVTWPGRKEIWASSAVVVVVAVIFMMIIAAEDWIIHQGLKLIY